MPEEIEYEILKAFHDADQFRFRDLRDRLFPKFKEKYVEGSFDVILTRVLQKMISNNLLVRNETKVTKKGVVRKQIRYVLKSKVRSIAFLLAKSKITEEEYFLQMKDCLTKLLEQGKKEEFMRVLTPMLCPDAEELNKKIQSDLDELDDFNERYFAKSHKTVFVNNPLVFANKYLELADDLDTTILEWRAILCQQERYKPEATALIENIERETGVLSSLVCELKATVKTAAFVSDLNLWNDEALAGFRDDLVLLLDRHSKNLSDLLQAFNYKKKK